MNLQNVKHLVSILSQTGFENLSYRLVQHICCKPLRFELIEKENRQADLLTCRLCFERKNDEYHFSFYDVSLIREVSIPTLTINQVAIKELEIRMKEIDWNNASSDLTLRLDDADSWKREEQIEGIINDLSRLSATTDGKVYADAFKVRFWTGSLIEEITGSLAPIRSKLEISQRFYVLDQKCITLDEAYRFLQNKWIERNFQLRRKEKFAADNDEIDNDRSSSPKQNLKKKRKLRVRVK